MTLQSPNATLIPLFPAQSTQGADILVSWIGKIVRTSAADGSRTFDFLCERRTPYPLGLALPCSRSACSGHLAPLYAVRQHDQGLQRPYCAVRQIYPKHHNANIMTDGADSGHLYQLYKVIYFVCWRHAISNIVWSLQSNLNRSNTFRTMKICSRQGSSSH